MFSRVNREMVANILGAEWESLAGTPSSTESVAGTEKEESSCVDTDSESRNNNN